MMFDQTGIPPTTCLVFNTGSVSCVPSVMHVAKCATDFASWPYDTHRCRINFGSWSHSGEEVNFNLDKKAVIGIELNFINIFEILKLAK